MPLTPVTTPWTDIYGQDHVLTTRPNNQDTQGSLEARHASTLAILQSADFFPPASA